MNQVSLIGRIVREVEVQQVGNGSQVINNTLAIQRMYKKDKKQEADFIPFVAWGPAAKIIADNCEKGVQIGLSGRMQSRTYLNKEDETVFAVELRVEEVSLLFKKKSEETAKIDISDK